MFLRVGRAQETIEEAGAMQIPGPNSTDLGRGSEPKPRAGVS